MPERRKVLTWVRIAKVIWPKPAGAWPKPEGAWPKPEGTWPEPAGTVVVCIRQWASQLVSLTTLLRTRVSYQAPSPSEPGSFWPPDPTCGANPDPTRGHLATGTLKTAGCLTRAATSAAASHHPAPAVDSARGISTAWENALKWHRGLAPATTGASHGQLKGG